MDLVKARAKSLARGLEPELSVAIDDVMLPVATFTAAVAAFQKQFPTTLNQENAQRLQEGSGLSSTTKGSVTRRPSSGRRLLAGKKKRSR